MEMRHLKPMFDLGNLALMPFSPRDDKSIVDSLERSDVVINLIGKHYETKHIVPTRRADGKLSRVNYPFREVHVDIPRKLARLAREAGIKSFIHVSALAADPNSKSEWARTKYEGEVAVREEFPDAIIVRPATVFGAEDRFLNLIGEFQERLPFVPIVNNGETLYQPVYCLDVSQGLLNIVNNHSEFKGDDFQFVGPAEYSYREIVEFVQDVSTVSKPIVAMPNGAAELAGRMINAGAINPIFSDDMLHLMSEDCVAKPDGEGGTRMKTLEDLGLNPRSMDRYSFDFLHRFRPGGHFTMVQGYH
jgi:NADH dehydrogenase (ubiquinone) 1 alpha subcomplex subunit 9